MGDIDRDQTNCFKLNPVEARKFDGGLHRMNTTGTFHYMSTRNNNYTNRSQKGTMIVGGLLNDGELAAVIGGAVVGTAAIAGAGFAFAKTHPHSAIAGVFPFN